LIISIYSFPKYHPHPRNVAYLSRHDHETFFPLPLLASKVSSGCFKVSRPSAMPEP